jgi:hypothetical protein
VATTLTQQTRYDTADLLMAADDKVFSRFMLTPNRGNLTGAEAIASGGVGAFIGFACPDFMRFDYLLGRQNCQMFLRQSFTLADNNKVFAPWTPHSTVTASRSAFAPFSNWSSRAPGCGRR